MYQIYKILILAFILYTPNIFAQVNAYAKVTAISGNNYVVSNVDESFDTFEPGEQVLIIQVQDDVLGSTTNDATFGDLGTIQAAGQYEVAKVLNINEAAGVPISIELQSNTKNLYNTGPNSTVQIVSFPTLGVNYTTTTNITALPWNGNIGGLVAFRVENTLTLNHSISADGAGFRGGLPSGNAASANCDGTTYFSATTNLFAEKGEGIYKNTNGNFDNAKGKLLTAGGGGNDHNGGGGGGGNFTAGGSALSGWACSAGVVPGGVGGIDLSMYYPNRIFMGGGGGGGHQNNNRSTAGRRGGGIVIIEATTITTSGSCNVRISANGNSVINDSGNDGSGAGGAGGALVLDVDNWNANSTCPLTIEARGGDGGSVGSSGSHSGGGGGARGAIIFSTPRPTANVTITNAAGNGGCDESNCLTAAENGAATALSGMTGVFDNTNIDLPVKLERFSATSLENEVRLDWTTAAEINTSHFVIERSKNGLDWEDLLEVAAVGGPTQQSDYTDYDGAPYNGTSYYRLRMVDYDATFDYSDVVAVSRGNEEVYMQVYPNPSRYTLNVNANQPIEQIRLINALGQVVVEQTSGTNPTAQIDVNQLKAGVYTLQVKVANQVIIRSIVVQD